MVDVDGLAREFVAQLVGDDLHIPGQDGELDVVFLHQDRRASSAWTLVSGVTGMWWNGMP